MPLFEVDAERPVLVQPTPTAGGFGTAAQRVVDGNLDGLLGEQIFPVTQGRSPQEPHLLALDAEGLPVVIDVVGELTEETLTRALNHAGAAGQLSRAELAARYPRGAATFHQDVAAFYDGVPFTRTLGSRSTGARLIVICQEAAEGVLDALDFLRQPGSPVAVLRLGVVKTADGRRFVDVSPLAVSREHRPVARATAQLADSTEFAEGVAVGRALTGKVPVVTRRPRFSTPHPGHSVLRTADAAAPPVAEAPAPQPSTSTDDAIPPVVTTASGATAPRRSRPLPSRAERRRAQEPTPAASTVEIGEPSPHLEPTPSGSVLPVEGLPMPALVDPVSPEPASPEPADDAESAHVTSRPDLSGNDLGADDDPDLITLAAAIGAPAALVWSRPRRGQRYEATLMPDGYIVLVDGSRFRHPDLAAVAVSGTQSADGWSVWRFGDDGPTLTDAFRARYS